MSDYDYMDERLTTPGPVAAAQNESLTLSSGTRFGRYEILSPLGAGGMGEVYRARDTRLGRDLAIKILSSKLSPGKQDFERFEREACSASALNHPNIVTIFELGQVDTTYYIAMELVEGELLRDMLAGGPIPLQKAIPIAAQAADGLAKAHEAGVVHRDLKPENLMVSSDGFVKILDFGLAKLVNRDSDQLPGAAALATSQTLPGAVLGTIEYMSPEQANGLPLDFRSDQFSFGSVLYEMVTGKRSFQRRSKAETLAAILRDDPEPVVSLNPQAPAPLCWVIERCLAKDPKQRYTSTRDLVRDLATIRDRLSEAPSRHSPPRSSNLPAQRTVLIGRDQEVEAVAELLTITPKLKILVTSRAPLHIYGEHEVPVPSLAVPDLRSAISLQSLSKNPAIALFLARAAAVKPSFQLTQENAVAVATICTRLDGLPLAIELAAARIKLLSPSAMQARLESSLQLLTGGAKDLPLRQQTLRGTIDWSYLLLGEAEQALFRRLSVFVGGCTLEGVEAVCNTKQDLGLDVLEGMASLVDKSLVQQIESPGAESRFVLLDTVREYGLERLAASGEERATKRAHAAYCLVLAEESASQAADPARTEWVSLFEVENDNFRAALE